MRIFWEGILLEEQKRKEKERQQEDSRPRIRLPIEDEKFITGDLPEDDEKIIIPL